MQHMPNRGDGRHVPTRQPLPEHKGDERDDEPRSLKGRDRAVQEHIDATRAPRTLYDDFDTYYDSDTLHHRRKQPHKPLYYVLHGFIILTCVLLLCSMGLLVAPQLLGVRFTSLPNYAFINGQVIEWDAQAERAVIQKQQYLARNVFFPGITVDGVDVSGMSMEQAYQAVSAVAAGEGSAFDLTLRIGSDKWHIDSSMVPMTRNTESVLRAAWAYGRSNTVSGRAQYLTPLEERAQQAESLLQQPLALTTALTYDYSVIRGYTDTIAENYNLEPVNAEVAGFDWASRKFSVTSDVSGLALSSDELYDAVMDCLERGDMYAEITLEPEVRIASVTRTELMSRLGRIASYSTTTTSNRNRNTNIELSAAAINGRVLQPGEAFSFNDATGQRTSAKGYKEAAAISGGASADEVGGGVCQTSSTLFVAVALANLEIVTRSPHAWPSSYVPEGWDATVNWPGLDFRFRNNTEYPVYIVASYASRQLTVEIYGMKLPDGMSIELKSVCVETYQAPSEIKRVQNPDLPRGTSKTTVQRRNGSKWQTYQVWYQHGQEVKRELLCTSVYKAYQQTVEYN